MLHTHSLHTNTHTHTQPVHPHTACAQTHTCTKCAVSVIHTHMHTHTQTSNCSQGTKDSEKTPNPPVLDPKHPQTHMPCDRLLQSPLLQSWCSNTATSSHEQ